MTTPSTVHLHKIGKIESLTAISVTSTATSITIGAGQGIVTLKNWGSSIVWVGGDDIDANNQKGFFMDPRDGIEIGDLKESVDIYFQCATGDSSTIVGIRA